MILSIGTGKYLFKISLCAFIQTLWKLGMERTLSRWSLLKTKQSGDSVG